MRGRWRGRLVLLLSVLCTIGCDRVTKRVATAALRETAAHTYLGGVVRLDYAENTGGFLSLGADWPAETRTIVFTVGTGLMVFALALLAIRRRPAGWPAIGIALFIAGAASNWIDRLSHGYVVDFMNVGIGPLRTGIFNVADVALMAGVAIVVLDGVVLKKGSLQADAQ